MATLAPPAPAAPQEPPPAPPPAPLLTAAEFVARYTNERVELVKGVVVEVPVAPFKHGKLCNRAAFYITQFVDAHDLGHVGTNDSYVAIGDDGVRGADVCFFSYERLPRGGVPDGLLPVTPDLVVEVRSPSETWTAVFTKVGEYLSAGVRAVVVVDADTRSASVYRADARQEVFEADADLALPDVLPGFALRVATLFA